VVTVPEPLAYTVAEAAQLTHLSSRTVRRAIKAGRLHAVHIGRAVRVPRDALAALLGLGRSNDGKDDAAISASEQPEHEEAK